MRGVGRALALAAGVAATIGSAHVGLTLLRQPTSSRTVSPEAVDHFIEADGLDAPLMESEVFSAEPSSRTTEFLGILRDPQAEALLSELAEHGAAGARLYGLCGLRTLGSKRLRRCQALARRDDRDVAIFSGCILRITSPRELVHSAKFRGLCDSLVRGVPLEAAPQTRP